MNINCGRLDSLANEVITQAIRDIKINVKKEDDKFFRFNKTGKWRNIKREKYNEYIRNKASAVAFLNNKQSLYFYAYIAGIDIDFLTGLLSKTV